jgi:hypothetical protein
MHAPVPAEPPENPADVVLVPLDEPAIGVRVAAPRALHVVPVA